MKKLICLQLIVLIILSGCSCTPHTAPATQPSQETTVTTTAAEDCTAEGSAATKATEGSTAPETEPTEDPVESETSVTEGAPETAPTAAPTQPPAPTQATAIPEPTVCLHANTVTVNEKTATKETEGYTGDTVCSDCGAFLCAGESIPKLKRMLTYTSPSGVSYTVEEGTNISDYTMKLKTWSETHPYADIEQEVFYLCNVAREKYGLPPLSWNEDAYCFTKIRAQDCFSLYEHIRPNGEKWNSVYEDHGVFLYCINGENLNQASNCTAWHIADTLLMADMIFGSWMDSSGHRENILNSSYTSVAISVLWSETENVCYVAQNFFGY